MLTNAIEVMGYIKASAGRSNLRVVFEDTNHPRHDGDTIYLPKITSRTTQEEMIEMMASTDHEVAHDRYSDFGILKEKKIDVTKSVVGYVWNFVEDSRVNYIEAKEYGGFRELWEQSTPKLLQQIKISSEVEPSPMTKLVAGLIRWDATVSGDMFPLCAAESFKFPEDKKLADVLEKFDDKLIACQNETGKVRGSEMTYQLAREIVIALGGDPDEKPPETESSEEDEEGKKKKEGKGSKEGEGSKEEKEGKSKEGESEKKEDEDWCIKKIKIKESDLDKLVTRHEPDRTRMSKVGLMYTVDKDLSGWTMTPVSSFVVVNYPKNVFESGMVYDATAASILNRRSTSANFFEESYLNRVVPSLLASENFAQQVRKELQIRSRVRYEYGVKRGKLDTARLARIVTKAPGYSERVFKNKLNATNLDAAISVLIDMSGSMNGDKALYAAGSAILVNKVCQVLGVAVEIAGFTDVLNTETSCYVPLHYLYKPFNTAVAKEDELLRCIGASSAHMTGNPDGENILYAYHRLLRRREKKRLLIVMSDGQPAASMSGRGLSGFTDKVIKEIEALKRIDIYGLGLLSRDVEDYYKSNSVVTSVSEIPAKLLELIERKLFV